MYNLIIIKILHIKNVNQSFSPAHKHLLTFLLVEDQLGLELPPLIQSSLDLGCRLVACFRAVQEVTRAALLHELGTSVTSELTETVRAVDDGVERLHLSVPQDEVTVCEEEREGEETMINMIGKGKHLCLETDLAASWTCKLDIELNWFTKIL